MLQLENSFALNKNERVEELFLFYEQTEINKDKFMYKLTKLKYTLIRLSKQDQPDKKIIDNLSLALKNITNSSDFDFNYFLYTMVNILDTTNQNEKKVPYFIFGLFMLHVKQNIDDFYNYFKQMNKNNKIKNISISILQIFCNFWRKKTATAL